MDRVHWENGADELATAITVPDWPTLSQTERTQDEVLASCIAYLDGLRDSPRVYNPPARGSHGLPYTCWTVESNQAPRAATVEDEGGTTVWY
jgi:hypothetical protein